MDQFESKAALCLNNIAIAMMRRSCFRQASNTLNDALSILHPKAEINETPNKMLEQANSRVFNPEKASFPVALTVIHHHNGIVEVPADYGSSDFSVIRIESIDIDKDEALALVVHNIAICCMYQATTSMHAQSCLYMCLSTLEELYNDSHCPFAWNRLVILTRNTGNALVRALEMAGEEQEAISFQTTFLVRLDQVEEQLVASGLFARGIMNAAIPAA
jgi:hypothetical protein